MIPLSSLRFIALAAGFVLVTIGCTSPSRSDLPPTSPFRETAGSVSSLLPQGVAVGDVRSDSVLVWLRTDEPAQVQIEYAPLSEWGTAESKPDYLPVLAKTKLYRTAPDHDMTLTVVLEKLKPATRYRYRIVMAREPLGADHETQASVAARGEFTTLAEPTAHVPVLFAWSGDLGGQQKCRDEQNAYPIFDTIRNHKVDFFLFLGDTIYGDDRCPSPPNVPGSAFTASTLEEYRAKHRYQRGAAALQRLLASVPVSVMWDDHEVRNNFAGPFDPQMPLGRQALRDYWPIVTAPDDPNRLYRRVRYGADLELFLLDTRQYRSRNADRDGPEKTMLGATQLAWLLDGLRRSTSTWKVIATSVPLSIPKPGPESRPGNDGWAGGADGTGFETELRTIVETILAHPIKNVVWIATDVHFVQANAYDPNGDGVPDFHEFVAGPLSAAFGRLTPARDTWKPTTLFHEGGYYNFGTVSVKGATLEVAIVDDSGKVRFTHRLIAR